MRVPYDTGRFAQVTGLADVASHTDAAGIVEQMRADLLSDPGEWENDTLDGFLDALAGYLQALPGAYANRGEPMPAEPTWHLLARILVAATGYE